MGAGQYPAGYYPAGFDPNVYTDRKEADQKNPVLFDAATKGTPRDADGFLKTIHWVDQVVALALGISKGSFNAQSSLGNVLSRIKRSAGPTVPAAAEDAVRRALSGPLDRGDIEIKLLTVDTNVRNRIFVTVAYVNLRLPRKGAAVPQQTVLQLLA